MRKKGLGRGLSELLSSDTLTRSRAVLEVSVDNLEANPYQPRHDVDGDDLEELTLSIETHGIVQPIVVRRTDTDEVYQIIAGERRWRAAQRAGLQTVPCILHEADDRKSLEIALVENLQRADLSPVEAAEAMAQLINEFGLTQDQLAEQLGRSRSTVSNSLRLLDLPEGAREALTEGRISEGHARALLPMLDQPSKLFDILQMIEDHGLSVREIEQIVRDHDEKPDVDTSNMEVPGEPARPETDPYIEDAKKRMRDNLGTKVTLLPKSKGGGTIHITYHDDEELDRLLNIIAPPGPASYRKLGE